VNGGHFVAGKPLAGEPTASEATAWQASREAAGQKGSQWQTRLVFLVLAQQPVGSTNRKLDSDEQVMEDGRCYPIWPAEGSLANGLPAAGLPAAKRPAFLLALAEAYAAPSP